MPELLLERDQRLALRAQAHHLSPVVLLGNAGLSPAALKEIDRALAAHELIKIRSPGDDRDVREDIAARIADELGAARIQSIGKILVIYRPKPTEPVEPAEPPDHALRGRAERTKARGSATTRPAAKSGARSATRSAGKQQPAERGTRRRQT